MIGRLFIARHGETVFNAASRMQGDVLHTPLTRAGFAQADKMGARLRALLGSKPALDLWASPTGRALQTLAQDCDVLVHMCHYLSGTAPSKTFAAFTMGHRELAELAHAARVRNLVLSHVTAQFDRPGMRERVIREVGEIFGGNIYFGEDLMEIPFAPPSAAKLD